MPDVDSTSPSDWKYVNEGGATIVFSYIGPRHPTFSGKVLRLRKSSSEHPQGPQDNADDPSIAFQRRVTSRLIPSQNLPSLDAICLQRTWLEALESLTSSARPLSRRAKDRLDTSRSKGVLATDLVGGLGMAVEIKASLLVSHVANS